MTVATYMLVDFDKPDLSLLEDFDWWGLISMAGFLGALEYVLEEGPRYDWFDDTTIAIFAAVSAASAVVFFVRVLTARAPIVDLRAFLDRNFAVGSLFSFVLGIGLYGLTYLYPVYLAQIRGYDALMIGDTMFVSGVGDVCDRADRRATQSALRSALRPDGRLRAVRRRHLADDLRHQGLGFLGNCYGRRFSAASG